MHSNLNRRQFTKAAAGLLLLPSATLPQVPKVEAPTMRLYSICDNPQPDDLFYDWWQAVWANNEEEALRYATMHYGGEFSPEELQLTVIDVSDASDAIDPETVGVHEERRFETLRLLGWHEDGEYACECCGLYAVGIPEHDVCDWCCLCPECRAEEEGHCDCRGGTDANTPQTGRE